MVDVTQRFDIEASFEVKTPDGKPFFSAGLKYSDFPYEGLVVLEREGTKLLNNLVELSEAFLTDKEKISS